MKKPFPPAPSLLMAALLIGLLAPGVPSVSAVPLPEVVTGKEAGLDLLRLGGALNYTEWMEREGWRDRRPFSNSAGRFRIFQGTLRMESRGESYLIGRELPPALARPLADYPFLRFVVRIAEAPRGARLRGEAADDSAFRLYAVVGSDPLQALVYVWSWELGIGEWSARGRSLLGDFRGVRRKSFGRGEPMGQVWLTVEVNLLRDFRAQFSEHRPESRQERRPPPRLGGLALKSDSNDTHGQRGLAWLRAVTLHRTSLRAVGLKDWDEYKGTVLLLR